ncbi:MAG: CHAP domain-containing protein [Anaerolineae bacterium]|nr:CHAP domain-containing protein [Anaerolineae bacterium]
MIDKLRYRVFAIAAASIMLILTLTGPQAAVSGRTGCSPDTPPTLVLDGMALSVCTEWMTRGPWITTGTQDTVQTATLIRRDGGFRELTVTAVPFGSAPALEALPVATSGAADGYRAQLRKFRIEQGATLYPAPRVSAFGEQVPGLLSVAPLSLDGRTTTPVAIVEWVAEFAGRLWIIRAGQALTATGPYHPETQATLLGAALSDLTLAGVLGRTSLTPPDGQQQQQPVVQPDNIANQDGMLPFPDWWDGDCDTNHYREQTGIDTFPLGATYRGVKACGPRPWYDGAPDVLVRFFPGAFGQYEWECVELSMRYLYLAHGTPPYPGNGKDVVSNYPGEVLVTVANGTPGQAPQPGDVLSYGPTTTYGHTAVVTGSDVDSAGNGAITIMEQNSSETGARTHTVSDWWVESYSTISGWLHDPQADPIPDAPPQITFTLANDVAVTAPGQAIHSSVTNWMFWGSASDDNGLDRLVYVAWGNNAAAGEALGTTDWTFAHMGLLGHNRIHVLAYDTAAQRNLATDTCYVDLFVDVAPPTVTHYLEGAASYALRYQTPVTVTLHAEDAGSGTLDSTLGISDHFRAGVAEIRYRLDDGAWVALPGNHGSFTVTTPGDHTLEYYASDVAGSSSDARTVNFTIDDVPSPAPSAAATTALDTQAPSGVATILEETVGPTTWDLTLEVTGVDPAGIAAVRVGYSPVFSDSIWRPFTSPITVPLQWSAPPTLYVQLRDNAGNVAETLTATYTVDTTPPTGAVTLTDIDGMTVTWQLDVADDLGAVTRLWLSPDRDFIEDVVGVTYQPVFAWHTAGETELYLRFEDQTGNVSKVYRAPCQYEVHLPLLVRNE